MVIAVLEAKFMCLILGERQAYGGTNVIAGGSKTYEKELKGSGRSGGILAGQDARWCHIQYVLVSKIYQPR